MYIDTDTEYGKYLFRSKSSLGSSSKPNGLEGTDVIQQQ